MSFPFHCVQKCVQVRCYIKMPIINKRRLRTLSEHMRTPNRRYRPTNLQLIMNYNETLKQKQNKKELKQNSIFNVRVE